MKKRLYYNAGLSHGLQEAIVNLAVVVDVYAGDATDNKEPNTVKLLEYIGVTTLQVSQHVAAELQRIETLRALEEHSQVIDLLTRRILRDS